MYRGSRKIYPTFRGELPRYRGGSRFGRARNTKYDRDPDIGITACIALIMDGEYLSIKLHRHGRPRDCGRILLQYYSSADRLLELFKEGDLVELGEDITPKTADHSLASPEPGVCVYVHRDCRIAEPKPVMFLARNMDELKYHFDVNYYYTYERGGWICHTHIITSPLDEAIQRDKKFY